MIVSQEYELVPVDRLAPHPDNPRRGNLEVLAESVGENGFYGAIVAQRSTGHVLAGNHRLKAAQGAGISEVPVVWVDVDDERARKILLVDNRSNDLASYDEESLLALLRDTTDLTGTGYTAEDLLGLSSGGAGGGAALTDPDATPDAPAVPYSKLGDVWALGPHRLVCGDATDPAAYRALLTDGDPHMVFTDPPYGVAYNPEARESYFSPERKARPLGTIENDALQGDALTAFLAATFAAIDEHLPPGAPVYVCHADTLGFENRAAWRTRDWKLASCIIWAKTVLVFGRSDYHWKHEPILYGWKNGAAHPWHGDRKQTSVWEISTDHYKRKDAGGYVHPTQKPVELVATALANSAAPGERVLDPFGGSGSTLIAAHGRGMHARLIELDPAYVDVICRRYQEHTGVIPVSEATGEPHDFTEGTDG